MQKTFVFLLALSTLCISYGQNSTQNSNNSEIIIGLNSGVGFYQWELPENISESGISSISNFDILYKKNNLKAGVGAGYDHLSREVSYHFVKVYVQTEYTLTINTFDVGPNLQFGYTSFFTNEIDTEENRWALYYSAGCTMALHLNQSWGLVLKPSYERKWPRQLIDSEYISTLILQAGVRYAIPI